MLARTNKYSAVLALACAMSWPSLTVAQNEISTVGLINTVGISDIEIYLKGPDGQPIKGTALVTVTMPDGQLYKQDTAKNGYLRLNELRQSSYNVQVIAPGYGTVTKQIDAQSKSSRLIKVTIQLQPGPEGVDAATDMEIAALAPKAQKALGKAIEELRANKTVDARSSLETAVKFAPKSAEVQYVFGVYESQVGDAAQAKAYWTKCLELYPQHFRALISLSEASLKEKKPDEALPFLERAEKVEPSSWRPHALRAEVYLRRDSLDDAIKEAERAMELGHAQAAMAQLVLTAALINHGEREKAEGILQTYLQAHPADAEAKRQLAFLHEPAPKESANAAAGTVPKAGGEIAEALPSSWLPPDIDDKPGTFEPGAVCMLDEVLKNAGNRMQEFLTNVDRFVATESIQHESINKWGMSSPPTTLKFDYLVSVHELKPGNFNVEEYRTNPNGPMEFPDGIATVGLPALALIFHPHNAENFEFACEGLARWNGALAWQVHFRQRADRPNTVRRYRVGLEGRSYPVDVKGRAWITADNFQIVRLETQMIAPVPEIRLAADYTAIEYGPVHFQGKNVEMWLPQSAEIYSDWKGRRFHRRHSFSKYMLFSVEDKETISIPKTAEEAPPKPDPEGARPNL